MIWFGTGSGCGTIWTGTAFWFPFLILYSLELPSAFYSEYYTGLGLPSCFLSKYYTSLGLPSILSTILLLNWFCLKLGVSRNCI